MTTPGWSGDDETRQLGEPPGTGSSGTRKPRLQIFTGMATTLRSKPGEPWQGDAETRPRSGSTTAADPAAQPTPLPATAGSGRTTRITALLSADGRRGPLSGAMWPDYELGDLLGQGGMGAVYRARQISVDRLVALKVLPAHLAGDADLRRRFEIEARASSTLACPHIVQVHHAGIHDGQLFFAMELVTGQSLSELMRARRSAGTRFALAESLGYVAQLAEALRVAGAAGVVHRDIKPANCMLDAQGQLKLADFGIAKILGEDGGTLTGMAMGTPSYLSPEQARGEEIDQRADLYSLGIMLYELATGRLPYVGGSPDALIYQHAFTEPPLPRSLNKDISADLQAVILKLIQKDPAARYADARELLTDLGRITGGMAPEVAVFVGRKLGTGADAALARIGGWRRRALWAAAAIVASAAALGGGWWWYDVRKTEDAQLRKALSALDRPVEIPGGAAEQLQRLARLAGERDPDVARWRADLARVSALQSRLGELTAADRLDLASAETVLHELQREIGDGSEIRQGRERLKAAQLDLAALRRELARLDAVDVATAAEATTLATRLERYRRLAPDGDGDGTRWAAALERSRSVIAGLRQRLAALDGERVAPAALADLGNDHARLHQLAGAEDGDVARWRRRLDEATARTAAWRTNLARLDGEALPGADAIATTAVDLAAWADAAGEDDADLRRWRGVIEASAVRRRQLSGTIAPLVDATIPAARLPTLAEEVGEFRRLAGLDDADGRRWAEAVSASRDRLAAWQQELTALDGKKTLSRADQRLAAAALDGLRGVGALDEAVAERWRQRLARDAASIDALARDLAVLDGVAAPPAGIERTLEEYVALAGNDPRAQVWRERLGAIAALRGRLAALSRQQPPPARAAADLDDLARRIGAGDPQVVVWRGKLARIDSLVRDLAALDRVQLPRPDARSLLDAYQREVGPDAPDLRRWRERLARIEALVDRLAGLEDRLLPDPGAAEACASLAAMIGVAQVEPQRRRLGELAGPPRPAWAVDAGADVHGRWVDADLGAARLRLRWIPSGTVRVGSPADEPDREADEAPVALTITRGFWLADRECTQAHWRALLSGEPALHRGDDLPVERVSWDQAGAWCAALAARLGTAARLPSEAEWEHAARGGAGPVAWVGPQGAVGADALPRLAVYDTDAPQPVARRLPNPLGLFDLHGNVWEWCQDGYAPYPVRPSDDHIGQGRQRVIRGGSWGDGPAVLRLANRQRTGVGRPSFTVPVASGGTLATAGASASTGLLMGLGYRLSRAWTIDVEAGWIAEAATLSGDDVDIDLQRSGASVGLGLSWAWSRRPVRLE